MSATPNRAARRLGVGQEPDPRFTLANERTLLAWARTALGSLVAGLAVSELLRAEPYAARLVVSLPLIAIAGTIAVASYSRWREIERALRLNRPLPYSATFAPLSVAIALMALTAAIVLVAR
jgi:putative membrane protein